MESGQNLPLVLHIKSKSSSDPFGKPVWFTLSRKLLAVS